MKLKKADKSEKRSFLVDCLVPSVKSFKNDKISSTVRDSISLSPNWLQNLENSA